MTDEERAARLLRGKNAPSVRERESMVQEILDEVGPGPRRPRWLRPVSFVVATGAAAAALFLMVQPPDEVTPRDGGGGVVLETICRPGPDCRKGSQLLFRMSNSGKERGHVAIFAKRADGLVIWYFPESETALGAPFLENQWLDEGVLIDETHEPGEYIIYAVVSDQPLGRERARQVVEAGGEGSEELLQTTVRIVP